jgi:hypothetical protein
MSRLIEVLFHHGIETEDQNVFQFPVELLSPEFGGIVFVLWRIFWYISILFLSSDMFLYIVYLILSVNVVHWLWGLTHVESPRVPRYFPLRIFRYFPLGVALVVVIVFLLLSTMVYVLEVFPHLPSEIGGGQARCARLDVQLDKLSQESAGILIEEAKVPATAESPLVAGNEIRHYAKATGKKMKKQGEKDEKAEETVTTREIYVVYISDKSLIFSPSRPVERAPKYEVSREAISLISWCVSSDPA